jgi:pSer/pThr/pTyr-binding forkhead associated (FHA) protein
MPPAPAFDPKKTQVVGGPPGVAGFDPSKTQVYQGPGVSPTQRPAPTNRKLIGWLVSFTIHPNGVDFRLYEGKNTIGSNPTCDIVLQDSGVSGHHLTLLIRPGNPTVRFKDEFSTNGTLLNGTPTDEGTLQDGDILKIGNTELRFRSV